MNTPMMKTAPAGGPALQGIAARRDGLLPGRRTLGPLALMLVCPPFAIVLWYTHVHLGGSLASLWQLIAADGLISTVATIWAPVFWGSPVAWTVIGVFAVFELALMKLVPGARFEGPITPKGNVPVYKANGVASFVISLVTYVVASAGLGLFDPAIVYDHFGEILGALNVFSLVFCLGLYLKGRFAPSSSDHGLSGNPVFDYYWGTELYPRVLGWDLKMFTNCRFGMMGWPIILVSFAFAQVKHTGSLTDAMFVAVAIQLVYIAKFFWWETGYLRSMDIMHDRAGFYICWGCLVWVPAVYTSHTLYLVNQTHTLGTPLAAAILVAGIAAVFMNYFADEQRQRVRATDGKTTIWGKEPEIIRATYTTEGGEQKESILLVSGFWGISRHFHYLPELAAAFLWSVPALFSHALPYFYPVFLAILLTDRAWRDDKRCAVKYGPHWQEYCKRVPYKIIPGIV